MNGDNRKADDDRRKATHRRLFAGTVAFVTSPITMIAGVLLTVAMLATPHYLDTMEQEIFEGELLFSICSGFSRSARDRTPQRPPLL